MKLRGKQKRFLRSEAHHMNPLVQIGKNGISETLLDQVDDLLERRELIKVNLLQNTDEEAKDVADVFEETLHCEVVQIIGRILVVYRESSKEKFQKISKQVQSI
ncbi:MULTISPECIES: ribosome assembly RNA-binding protein YhbY [Vagococcus]|uniref:RNA binding protein n=1 Tax=Vagococcus fluvialis bH819 TaxID=1255619 RepID=A0A1X6WK26_9ENTE|nr:MULTISPECIES: ribosome assembly RNA-binding protein YhbY [Vagococcus]SLM84635.1 RNA binding protein [Vagococcus fluvialis bH819]HCM89901.1 ribosome assembly RNA-binding protein YhbY [Vagococcus sp.]